MSQKSYQRYTPEFKEQALGPLALLAVIWATNTLPSDSRVGVPEMRPVAGSSAIPKGSPPLAKAQDVAAGDPAASAGWNA